jgi:hypothetical protein
MARESRRAAAYYDELSRELDEHRQSLPAADPGRAPLESKLRAIALEREGRLAELRGKYKLEAEVALLAHFAHREHPDRSIVNAQIGHRERSEATLAAG